MKAIGWAIVIFALAWGIAYLMIIAKALENY